MTRTEKECRMWALVAEMKGMEAENSFRAYNGNSPNYGDTCFYAVAEKLTELSKEPEAAP